MRLYKIARIQGFYVHVFALSPTQRQMLAFAGNVGIGATGTGDNHRGVAIQILLHQLDESCRRS